MLKLPVILPESSLTLSMCSVRVCSHRSTLVSRHRGRTPWAALRCRVTPFRWSRFQLEPLCLVSQLPGEIHISPLTWNTGSLKHMIFCKSPVNFQMRTGFNLPESLVFFLFCHESKLKASSRFYLWCGWIWSADCKLATLLFLSLASLTEIVFLLFID